ncbi:WD repeat-containing protein 97 isoform X2 [Rhinoderma darwinii]|uniref:WD repeat-containing protein 97 isoform X2 n=1 Tax=Rhinoderma darwinii TaxID=43563 RepID=UPI003F66977D
MSGAGGSDLHLPRSLSSDKAAREKCLKAWDRLRKEYQRVVIQMRRADLQPSVLVHGLQSLRQVTFPIQLQYAAYISEQKSLVSVDCAGTLRLHDKDGRVFGTRHLKYPVAGLLYACQVQQYVAWNHQELLLFDESFMFLSRIPVMQDVFSCVYHPGRNLVFSAGYGGVISWSFGQSRRSLVRHQSLNQGMMAEDKVTVLTIDTKSHTCYAACGTSVWEYDVSDGTLRRVRRHLHNRGISSLLYAEYLHLLISGSRDGSIKVWGCAAQLLAVYVGHTGPVTALSLTSSGVVLVSGSGDATLRTWDLTTKEQMEEQRVSGSLLGLEAFCSHGDCILSYCSHELCVWQVQHLYQLHCLLGTAVTKIIVSEERIPSRALCVCADATMRLICPSTGELITTLDGEEQLLGAEYCALQGTVYALLGDGHLLKASALTNPMRGISRVQVSSTQRLPCCFSLFSCIVDKEEAVREQQHDEAPKEKEQLFNRTKHRFFCIIGFDDGSLQVYDWSSNQLQGETEAHSPGQVTCLMSNPENHHIVSAGSDLTVKVWRFFPYSKESLNLCMSFPCAQQVGHMCSLNSQLFVAFHDSSSATYELVQYCLKTGTRSDHPSSDDHQDQITGLCASPGLGLVASCGKDRMIRIWTEENRLLRILCLNALPESLSFCSSEGRLLVGIHGHVYHISLLNLLPEPYKLQILCMASPPAAPDPPVSDLFSRGLLPTRNSEDCFLIKSRDYMKKVGQREEEFLILSTRDRELRLIQMGELRSSKRTKSDKKIRREAMEKYLQLFYQEKSSYSIPEQDDFDPEELLVPSGVQEPKKLSFTPLENNRGFFTDSALGFSIDSIPKHLQVCGLTVSPALYILRRGRACSLHIERMRKREESPALFN